MGQPGGWDRGQVRLFVRELRKRKKPSKKPSKEKRRSRERHTLLEGES